MLGPTGSGVLWGRTEILERMGPFLGGGSMIRVVHPEESTWGDLPQRFEAGTPDIAGAIGLGAAIDYLQGIGMGAVRQHERDLTSYTLAALRKLGDATIYGPLDVDRRGGVVCFNYADIHPHDLGTVLDAEGVAIRAGHHCCQPLHRWLGVAATARASLYIYNVPEEVDALVGALAKAKELFSGVRVG